MTPFYIVVKADEINGKLAARDGKLLVHLPNYFALHEQLPVLTDDSKQVFKVNVADGMFAVIDEGHGPQPRLWSGAKGERSRPMDLVTVEVTAVGDQLADLPSNVQLAAAVVANTEAAQVLAGRTNEQIIDWANNTLIDFSKG